MAGAPLKNARHEKFAALVASGMAAGPAYAKAGYTSRSTNARDKGASTLLRDGKVSARVEELKLAQTQEVLQVTGLGKNDVIQMLFEQHLRNTGKLMVTHRTVAKKGKDKGKIMEVTTTEYDGRAASQTIKLIMDEFGLGEGASGARGESDGDINVRAGLDAPEIVDDLERLQRVRKLVLVGHSTTAPAPAPKDAMAQLKKLAGEK